MCSDRISGSCPVEVVSPWAGVDAHADLMRAGAP